MTSTNEGKDVKSNLTSGPKGKSYYIELYKSLDASLNAAGSLSERTAPLCSAWRRVHTLCLHSAPSTHPHLLAWIQRHTARTILQTEWQSPNSKDEHAKLTEAIDAFISEGQAAIASRDGASPPWEGQLLQRAEWFKSTLSNPWGHPVLRVLLDPRGQRPTTEEILEWLKEERGVVFCARLRQLALSKCDDLALTLLTAVMDRVRAARPHVPDHNIQENEEAPAEPSEPTFENILNAEGGFLDVWDTLTDMELVLLHKSDRNTRLIDLTKLMPLASGYQLVERLMSRLESAPREKRLWKNAKDVAMLATQVMITRCMVVPSCSGTARTVLYWCARALVRGVPQPRLPKDTVALAAPASTARHLHTFATAVHAQQSSISNELKPFVVELYVRAITFGMNELEKLKLMPEYGEKEARSTEQTLASWFIQLGQLLSSSARMKCECTLTAFSVHPSPPMYDRIKHAPPLPPVALDTQDVKKDESEPTSQFGSWANDSRSQTNFVKTSETLNMKQTQHKTNVLSTAILNEGEALGLAAELCQDIIVLLSGPRVKTLSWDMDRELLLENCRSYMKRTHGGTRALTTELKYLNLDLSHFQHLPEEEDGEDDIYYGIEKGYEHLVELQEPQPEEIWEDALFDEERTESAASSSVEDDMPIRKKKNKHAIIADPESDPLSLVAEIKRAEKKERPHSKERSKEPKKKQKEKHSNKEHDRRKNEPKEKKKEKKERKKKEKKQDRQTEGPMSSLIGLRVVKPETVTQIQTTHNICVTDSAYESQGKSLHSDSNDPNVLYDGQFSMDELKSPEMRSPEMRSPEYINKNLYKNKVLNVADGHVSMNKPQQHIQNASMANSYVQPRPLVYAINPNANVSASQDWNKNIQNVREEVKRSISKLIQFRRQKVTEAANAARSPNSNHVLNQGQSVPNPKQSVANQNQSVVKQNQSVVNQNPSVLNQSQIGVSQSKNLVNESQNVLHQYKNVDVHPTMQASQQPQVNMAGFIGSKVVNHPPVGLHIHKSGQAPDTKNVLSSLSARPPVLNQNNSSNGLISSKDTCSKVQPVNPAHSRKTYPKLTPQQKLLNAMNDTADQSDQNNAQMAQKSPNASSISHLNSYQEFLKELQMSTNAGLYDQSSETAKHVKRKEVKPVSRVVPVVPNVVKSESKPSPQCAKPVVQQKKVENAPNTFSRLSYMHKNKHNEKSKHCEHKTIEVNPLHNSISADLERRIADLRRTKATYLQTKNHYVATRIVNHTTVPSARPKESWQVDNPTANEPNSTAVNLKTQHPVLSKILKGNTGVTVTKMCSPNSEPSMQGEKSPTPKPKYATLSEKDQDDILNLLSQKNVLNRPQQLKVPNTSVTKNTSQTFTNPTVNKKINKPSTAPSTQNKCSVGQATSLNAQEKILDTKTDTHMQIDGSTFFPVISNSTIQKTTELIQTKKAHGKSHDKGKEKTSSCIVKKITTETDTAQKTVIEENKPTKMYVPKPPVVIPKQTEEMKEQDWTIVLDALRAQKTPTRGPNALDMVLNRGSFGQPCQKAQDVKSNCVSDEKAKKSAANAMIQAATSKPSISATPKLISTQVLNKKVDLPKKPSAVPAKTPSLPNRLMLYPEVTKQPYPCKQQKQDDPFISGIHNSDYEILEELMDDDLRQEIGELSSDEESYCSVPIAAPKAKVNPNTKINSTETNKTVQAKPKPEINKVCDFELRAKATEMSTPPATTFKKPDSKLRIISNEKVDLGKLPETLLASNVIRHLPKAMTPKVQDEALNHNLVAPSTHVAVSAPAPQTNLNSNVFYAAPTLVQNVVVYNPYFDMSKMNPTFTVVNETASIGLYQPEFTATMPGQVLVTTVTVPTVNVTPASNVPINITGCNQTAVPNVPMQTLNAVPITNTSTAITNQTPALNVTLPVPTKEIINNTNEEKPKAIPIPTTSTGITNQTPVSNVTLPVPTKEIINKTNEEKPKGKSHKPGNQFTPLKHFDKSDLNINKPNERKVLSEVQEKLKMAAPEKTQSLKSKNQKSLECEKKNEVSKDQERLAKKRLALMNREIHRRSFLPAIPLQYIPLSVFKNAEEKSTVVLGSIMNDNDKKDSDKTSKDVQKSDTKPSENTKENKDALVCSVLHLKSQLKDDEISNKGHLKRRMSKVRLKHTIVNKIAENEANNIESPQLEQSSLPNLKTEKSNDKNVTLEASDDKTNKEDNSNVTKIETPIPTRVSKRILNKKIKKNKEKSEKAKSLQEVSIKQQTEVNEESKTDENLTTTLTDKSVDDHVKHLDVEDAILGIKIPNTKVNKATNTNSKKPRQMKSFEKLSFEANPETKVFDSEKEESNSETIEILSSPEVIQLNSEPLSKFNITKPGSKLEIELTKPKNVLVSVLHDTVVKESAVKKNESLSKDVPSRIISETKDDRKGLKNASVVKTDSMQEKVTVKQHEMQSKLFELVDDIESAINAITESTISSPLTSNENDLNEDINTSTKLHDKELTPEGLSSPVDVPSVDEQYHNIDVISSRNTKSLIFETTKCTKKIEKENSIDHCVITSAPNCNKHIINDTIDKSGSKKCSSNKLVTAELSTAQKNINKTTEKVVADPEIPQAYKDSIHMEETFMPGNTNPNTRYFRIKLPNKKTFKATVYGKVHISIDTLFEDPALKQILLSGMNDKKRYTVSIQQKSNVDNIQLVDTRIHCTNIKDKPAKEVETVNLISDDEDETPSKDTTTGFHTVNLKQTIITESGTYKIKPINKETFDKHQQKLTQKCIVNLHKLAEKSNLETLVNALLEDLVVLPTQTVPEVIDLDGSSSKVESEGETKLDELKNLLLHDLGVADVGQSGISKNAQQEDLRPPRTRKSQPLDSENKLKNNIDIAKHDDDPKVMRDCYVKLVNCDYMLKNIENDKKIPTEVDSDVEVITCDDEDDTVSVLSRSGSFSILNNLKDIDNVSTDGKISPVIDIYETINALERISCSGSNSPVMEVFDLIAAFQENAIKSAETPDLVSIEQDLICESEWFMTKRDLYSQNVGSIIEWGFETISGCANKNDTLSDCDTDVTDPNFLDCDNIHVEISSVPSLTSIMSKYFEDNPIVNQLTPITVRRTLDNTVPVSLKRKLSDQGKSTYKLRKVPDLQMPDNIAGTNNKEVCVQPENDLDESDKSMSILEQLSVSTETSDDLDNCPSPSLLTEDVVTQLPDAFEMTKEEQLTVETNENTFEGIFSETTLRTETFESDTTLESNISIQDNANDVLTENITPEISFDTSSENLLIEEESIPKTETENAPVSISDESISITETQNTPVTSYEEITTPTEDITPDISLENALIEEKSIPITETANTTVSSTDEFTTTLNNLPKTVESEINIENLSEQISDENAKCESMLTRMDIEVVKLSSIDDVSTTIEDIIEFPKCEELRIGSEEFCDQVCKEMALTETQPISPSEKALVTGSSSDNVCLPIDDAKAFPICDELSISDENSRTEIHFEEPLSTTINPSSPEIAVVPMRDIVDVHTKSEEHPSIVIRDAISNKIIPESKKSNTSLNVNDNENAISNDCELPHAIEDDIIEKENALRCEALDAISLIYTVDKESGKDIDREHETNTTHKNNVIVDSIIDNIEDHTVLLHKETESYTHISSITTKVHDALVEKSEDVNNTNCGGTASDVDIPTKEISEVKGNFSTPETKIIDGKLEINVIIGNESNSNINIDWVENETIIDDALIENSFNDNMCLSDSNSPEIPLLSEETSKPHNIETKLEEKEKIENVDFTEVATTVETNNKLIQTDMQDNNNKSPIDFGNEIKNTTNQEKPNSGQPNSEDTYVCQTEIFVEKVSGSPKLNRNIKKTYLRESGHRTFDINNYNTVQRSEESEAEPIPILDCCDGNEITVEKSIGEIDGNISLLESNATLVYKDDSGVILKGIEYEDPEIGTCFVFPIVKGSDVTEANQLLNQSVESTIEVINENKSTFHDENELHVLEPKRTYYKRHLKRKSDIKNFNTCNKRPRRNSRVRDYANLLLPERKYRKGKNIDFPKPSRISIAETSYIKEFKSVLDYQDTINFSYAISFSNQYIDVSKLIKNWPIKGSIAKESQDQVEASSGLFVDTEPTEKPVRDPVHLTLVEEITAEYNDADYTSDCETDKTNFNMGFGEGSGRVIQNLDGGAISKFSAATLSDVKQSQPFLQSKDGGDSGNPVNFLESSKRQQIQSITRFFNYVQLRDKVRTFFKNTAIELACVQQQDKINDKKSNDKSSFLFELCTPKYIEPNPLETVVQVVQVGQLPVSAAAQNPVTCDPRVTQVSDASPSQCSAGNSLHDDSQPEIKTEYTELTTAEMSLPMVGEYIHHNQTANIESQEPINLSNEDIPIKTEIVKAEIKIEIEEDGDEKERSFQNSEQPEIENHVNNVNYLYDTNTTNASVDAEFQALFGAEKQESPERIMELKQQNGSNEKTDQIAHAMNAAGITTSSETVTSSQAQALVNLLSQKMRQGVVTTTQNSVNNYPKTTSVNTISLQQALAQILPPPLNQTNTTDNNQQGQNQVAPVLHIVQGKNASGNQITLVDNSQQSVITTPTATPVLHIVQNKPATTGPTSNGGSAPQSNTFSGISLVDAGLQQGGNQLLHIVNTGTQNKNTAGQLLKRVNLLTNLTNVQGSNEQKMVQFVCKSADGKAIQLNAPHQRSMVLRLQPIETPNIQTAPAKPTENQDLSPTQYSSNSVPKEPVTTQQEIKSRSVYEENYAKFIQNSNKSSLLEKSTSLPKFNQAFGKQVYQDGKQNDINSNNSHLSNVNNTENTECQPADNVINLDHIRQIGSPPLLLRKPPQATQAQTNLVQQIKQTIAPMNIQTMHGGVIYTRQIPVNIGAGQTINLITVPSTELIDESGQKQQVNQGDIEPSIIKIVPQSQPNTEVTPDDMNVSGENGQNPSQPQPVLTQMRIKLPMLSKNPHMVAGTRVVRPSFFQIQRNVIAGTNQPVYQQLVLTAAPPLGQQTIRLPQAPPRQVKVPESPSSSESMSSSTLEQLREFDMVLEQVKERSTVQPNSNSSTSTSYKIQTTSTDTTDSAANATSTTTETTQVLYSIGGSQPLNVAYVNRKTTITTPATSSFTRSPDSSGIADSPSSSTHVQIHQRATSEASCSERATPQPKPAKVSSKKRHKSSSHSHSNSMKMSSVPPKTSTQKPLEDEQTTQRILYILAEYKEQVENSPDKDKPAPRRRSNPPTNPGSSKRKKSSSGSRKSGGRDISPVDDSCRTMGSEDSSCGTSQGDCTENCLESHSPQDSPRKVARKLNFEQETNASPPKPQPQRNVIVADGQTITVARGTAGKPATAVLMPANYILPVSMVKGGQQIAIVTNRGPKLLTVGGGEGGATNTLLLQRLIGPAGLKPVLARPGVRHVRLPTAALHNLQAFNLATATTVQPPDSTASPSVGSTPPDLVDTRAEHSPWADRESGALKPERASSPDDSEPWNLPTSADTHDYTYEETVRADHMDRTVLVVQKKDSSQRQARLAHVSAAALRHKYAILEHELRLQKSLSEECEDLGVDSPSASELFPEAELLFASSPAQDHGPDTPHTPQSIMHNQSIHADIDDQIATDQLLPRNNINMDERQEIDVNLGLEDVGIVTVSEDGMQTTIALDQEEFARAHPNTTFHSEPTDEGEVQPFTISGLKARHITSTIFHANRAPATVLMTAPQTTVISQATVDGTHANPVKYSDIDNMINSLPGPHTNTINLSSVLVKDDGLTRFDSILTDSRELHLSNTASAIVHSTGSATQVIRRVCYDDDNKRERDRLFLDEPDALIAGEDAKMLAEDSSRDATMESMVDVDDGNSSPERHAELFWESNSASERSEGRRPMDFSSDSEKCCKSPSYDETNSTDSSGVGTHMRLDSVIKEARGRDRSGSADGSSAEDTHPPLRTYPAKRLYHALEGGAERSVSGKTRAGERSPDSVEVRRRASLRGVVKRGCHCCSGEPAPPRPKKPRQRKPTMDFNAN